MRSRRNRALSIAFAALVTGTAKGDNQTTENNLKRLGQEELSQIEVVSPSKEPEQVMRVPMAIYVITSEDIRRSAAASIPDALLLAPGVEVAQIEGSKWSVGIRGFGSRLSRSVLVMIDGRTVYTTFFGGTYWEVQDTIRFNAKKEFSSEQLNGYELGYRQMLRSSVYVDVATFYNHYDDLFSEEITGAPYLEQTPAPAHLLLPAQFRNGLLGSTEGYEIAPEWRPLPWCTLRGSYSYVGLAFLMDANHASVTSDPLPSVKVYEGHLIPLFQNLIGNAIKYRGEQPPRVHIQYQRAGDGLQFSVSDNGIGIAPEYHGKIFAPFKRLHGPDVPGSGIGLAICQRVVERYGGRIWVQSKLGEGSTFRFTLPDHLLATAAGTEGAYGESQG